MVAGLRPGATEQDIAGTLIAALLKEGIDCVAIFVGSDERISAHRHPLPTNKTAHDRVMVACCGRRHGLVGTITRMASFKPLRAEARRYLGLLEVERIFLDHSRPRGCTWKSVLHGGKRLCSQSFRP